jgi:hypothetical protein
VNHLTRDAVEALVQGVAPATEAQRRHLAACPECAARLAREARFEMQLLGATGSLAPPAGAAPRSLAPAAAARVALTIAATLALVALGTRLIGGGSAPRGVSMPHPAVVHLGPDTPCLVDPVSLAPGHDVVEPEPAGLRDTPVSTGRGLE